MRSLSSGPFEEQKQPSWVVVHDGPRDHYQLPLALAEEGLLERFVTDWYTPLDRAPWRSLTSARFLESRLRLRKRYCEKLASRMVTDTKAGYAFGFVRRKMTRAVYRDDLEGATAGRLAARIANRTHAGLFATSYSASAAFEELDRGLCKVLFQVHPEPRYLRRLYQTLIDQDPEYSGLAREQEMIVSDDELTQWSKESELADHVICASCFTKKTLIAAGRRPEEVSVVPYGVDANAFPYGAPEPNQPLRVLFVGQKVARKSLQMLLSVWSELKPENAELIVAGGHNSDESILSRYSGSFVNVPRVSRAELLRLFQQSDLFVLPSVVEGFGHVYLEALSTGTPIVCTENTGGADLIRDQGAGWIVEAGNADDLRRCLIDALSDRGRLKEMRPRARAIAERHTWQSFREKVRDVLAESSARHEEAMMRMEEAD